MDLSLTHIGTIRRLQDAIEGSEVSLFTNRKTVRLISLAVIKLYMYHGTTTYLSPDLFAIRMLRARDKRL